MAIFTPEGALIVSPGIRGIYTPSGALVVSSGVGLIERQGADTGVRANFDFQNIPQDFNKLIIDVYGRGDTLAVGIATTMRFNNDATANIYKYVLNMVNATPALGGGGSAGATSIYALPMIAANGPANVFDVARIEIPNYANTVKYKTCIIQGTSRQGAALNVIYSVQISGWWDSANAINRVTITPGAGNFAQYSQAWLYGVL